MEYSNTGTSKRARMPGSGSQVPSCLVDGCCSDLSKCRDYHRRHKVCEPHSKASKVFVRGVEQRFCQQCSRFHSLLEFDEGKRSCRKRLEGHNRRRRKPQPDSLFANSPQLFSNSQGTRYIHFGDSHSSPVYSSSSTATTTTTAAFGGVLKEEDDSIILNYHSALNFSDRKSQFPPGSSSSSSSCSKDVIQLHFLQGTTATPMFPRDCVGQGFVDPNRALSLLSSPSPTAVARETNVSHVVETCPNPMLISSLNYGGGIGVESQPLGSVLVPDISGNANNIHVHGVFHLLQDGSSSNSNGPQQKLSFTWN